MITAETVKEIEGYTVTAYTYSADVSATGEELTTYEVYNNNADMLDAFDSLQEAIDYVDNQIAWDHMIAILPPHEAIARY